MSKAQETCKFSTAYESMDSEKRTAKEAGLSKKEAIAFEKKECFKALHAALLKKDVSEDDIYGVIQNYIDLMLSALTAVNTMYA